MANRRTKTVEPLRLSLSKRSMWSSSSDEDENIPAIASRICAAARRNPPSPMDGGVAYSSSSDEEKTARTQGCKNNPPTSPTSPMSSDRFTRSRIDAVDQAIGQDVSSRRDNNPFSFKAFLKNDTQQQQQQTNYHNTGARPKVYTSPTSSPGNVLDKDNTNGGVYSGRNPTELPDFVQDHLVIEQCYLNHETSQPVLPDVDNLPDFALNSVEQRQSRLRNETKKNDSDVLCTKALFEMRCKICDSMNDMHSTIHLDLPTFEDRQDESASFLPSRSEHRKFPFDLPLPLPESNPSASATARDGPPSVSETNVHKSLPDFLSDGPIHNRSADPEPVAGIAESGERKLLLENERLRHQLEVARRQINEKAERIRLLEAELLAKREVEHEETAHLEKAMEQVEDNLKRSTKRAVNAESTVTSLKKEIKTLTTEISLLRLENSELRAGISAAGQGKSGVNVANRTIKRLASDLFAAASSAEVSLRQLISGVDNLRVLASTLENMDRIEDWTKDFLPDSDEDNAAGPAV